VVVAIVVAAMDHGGCHGYVSSRFPLLHRLSLRLFSFHAVLSVLCCRIVFKGDVLAAKGASSSQS